MMAQGGLGTVIGNVEGTEASLKELQRLIAAQKLRELEARQAEQEQYERGQQAREFGLRERESRAREEQSRLTREMLETERKRAEARAQRDDTRASLEQLPIGTELSEPEFQQSGFDRPEVRALFKATPAYQPEGPVQEGGILPKVPARFRATGTAGQLAKQESERRAQENLERQESGQREAERHNRAMEGRPTGQSTVIVRDFDPETGRGITRVEPRQAGRRYETNLAPTADMRNKAEARKRVSASVSAVQRLSEEVLTKVGPAQRATALARGGAAVLGNDPTFRTYQDARMALAGNLAVAQQGSRPSDADIRAIWLPLVPDAFRDTADSAKMKWDLIRNMSYIKEQGGGSPDEVAADPMLDQLHKQFPGAKITQIK